MTAFRLAAVLRLRRTVEEECEMRAAAAHRRVVVADGVAARRHEELVAASLTAGDRRVFLASATHAGFRGESAREADRAVAAARDDHRARIDELVRASMDVAALERLEDRMRAAALLAERTREAREIDDLVTARFARRRGGLEP